MNDLEMFIFNDTSNFPYNYPHEHLIPKSELMETLSYMFYYDSFRSDDLRYIGVYYDKVLQDVIFIDYNNFLNTMNDLKPHMNY